MRARNAPLLAPDRFNARIVAVRPCLPFLDVERHEVKTGCAEFLGHRVVKEDPIREHARGDMRVTAQIGDDVNNLRMKKRFAAAERNRPHVPG